jgi:hypothetical protein
LEGSPDRRIGIELLPVLNGQHLSEPSAGPVDPALDRAHSHPAHLGRLLIRQAFGPDQEQGLTLIKRDVRQSLAEVLEIKTGSLLGRG